MKVAIVFAYHRFVPAVNAGNCIRNVYPGAKAGFFMAGYPKLLAYAFFKQIQLLLDGWFVAHAFNFGG